MCRAEYGRFESLIQDGIGGVHIHYIRSVSCRFASISLIGFLAPVSERAAAPKHNLIGFPAPVSERASLRDAAENIRIELFVAVLHLAQEIEDEVVYLIVVFLIHDWKCVGSNETYGTESLPM